MHPHIHLHRDSLRQKTLKPSFSVYNVLDGFSTLVLFRLYSCDFGTHPFIFISINLALSTLSSLYANSRGFFQNLKFFTHLSSFLNKSSAVNKLNLFTIYSSAWLDLIILIKLRSNHLSSLFQNYVSNT